MTDETVVAVYDSPTQAEAAVAALKAAGAPDSAITLHAESATAGTTTGSAAPGQGFWSRVFGGEPDHDTSVYDRSMKAGGTVVSVRSPEVDVPRVVEILESQHPIDIDERAAGYSHTETTTTTTAQPIAAPIPATTGTRAATAVADDGAIQLSEESLVVGTRVVNRGGTRIRRFVVEKPVEQQVTLHDETETTTGTTRTGTTQTGTTPKI